MRIVLQGHGSHNKPLYQTLEKKHTYKRIAGQKGQKQGFDSSQDYNSGVITLICSKMSQFTAKNGITGQYRANNYQSCYFCVTIGL